MAEPKDGCVTPAKGPILKPEGLPSTPSQDFKGEAKMIAQVGKPVDPDGVVQAMEVLTPAVGRNVSELIRQVKAFQHVRQTSEVIPSGWQPGKSTLKPGPDLVGKVWKVWKPEMAF